MNLTPWQTACRIRKLEAAAAEAAASAGMAGYRAIHTFVANVPLVVTHNLGIGTLHPVVQVWSGGNMVAVVTADITANTITLESGVSLTGEVVIAADTPGGGGGGGGGGGSGGGAASITNLSVTRTVTNVTVVSSDGTDATIPAATRTDAGVMSAAQVVALEDHIADEAIHLPDGTPWPVTPHTDLLEHVPVCAGDLNVRDGFFLQPTLHVVSGTLVATTTEATSANFANGNIATFFSYDSGRTWSNPEYPLPAADAVDAQASVWLQAHMSNVAHIDAVRGGCVMVAQYGIFPEQPQGRYNTAVFTAPGPHGPWTRVGTILKGADHFAIVSSRVIELPDRSWITGGYHGVAGATFAACYRSIDRGVTWTVTDINTTAVAGQPAEPAIFQRGGRLYMYIRHDGPNGASVAESADGITWTAAAAITLHADYRANGWWGAHVTADGSVLAVVRSLASGAGLTEKLSVVIAPASPLAASGITAPRLDAMPTLVGSLGAGMHLLGPGLIGCVRSCDNAVGSPARLRYCTIKYNNEDGRFVSAPDGAITGDTFGSPALAGALLNFKADMGPVGREAARNLAVTVSGGTYRYSARSHTRAWQQTGTPTSEHIVIGTNTDWSALHNGSGAYIAVAGNMPALAAAQLWVIACTNGSSNSDTGIYLRANGTNSALAITVSSAGTAVTHNVNGVAAAGEFALVWHIVNGAAKLYLGNGSESYPTSMIDTGFAHAFAPATTFQGMVLGNWRVNGTDSRAGAFISHATVLPGAFRESTVRALFAAMSRP